jgi:hypothetical protein
MRSEYAYVPCAREVRSAVEHLLEASKLADELHRAQLGRELLDLAFEVLELHKQLLEVPF